MSSKDSGDENYVSVNIEQDLKVKQFSGIAEQIADRAAKQSYQPPFKVFEADLSQEQAQVLST